MLTPPPIYVLGSQLSGLLPNFESDLPASAGWSSLSYPVLHVHVFFFFFYPVNVDTFLTWFSQMT